MTIKSLIVLTALTCFAFISFGCGGGSKNTVSNKSANTTNTTTTTSTTTTAAPDNAETVRSDSTSPNTGVPECDEYITKYEACLTTIAAKAPQAAPGLRTSFEAQRDAFKKGASTPEGKAALAPQCKAAISNAKNATTAWCTNW
jgi:hypothetical protein